MKRHDLPIAEPCTADWQRMERLERKRYCELCDKHVHDLSKMTRDEASALLHAPRTRGLCIRYLHDAEGNIVFQPERLVPGYRLNRAKRAAKRVATAAAAAGHRGPRRLWRHAGDDG